LTEEVQRLKAENEVLSRQCSELETELATVKTERDDYAATVDEFIKDHKRWQERALTPEKRDRILNALGVGKQSPTYKRVKAALDQMMP
jgi:chromosome segregation ATPase